MQTKEWSEMSVGEKILGSVVLIFILFVVLGLLARSSEKTGTDQSATQPEQQEESQSEPPSTEQPTPQPEQQEESQPEPPPTASSKDLDEFPKKLEDYLNNTWDEIPGTYKVYWWDEWEGVDSGRKHLCVEPGFEPTEEQCQRIAQVATVARVGWVEREEGTVHVVAYDNSRDYCKLRTP